MKRKINVSYIVKNLDINGISIVLANYCHFLDKDKFNITVYAGSPISDVLYNELISNNIHVVKTPPKRGGNPLKYFLFLYKNINSENTDVLHVHGNSATLAIELLIAKIKGIKIKIAHSHNTTCDKKIAHFFLKPILNLLCDYPVACCEEAGKWMFGDNNNFLVIPNGNDFDKFKFNYERRCNIRKKHCLDDKIVIGHVGNFNYQKNHQFIIDVLRLLKDKYQSKYHIVLIGDGPEKENFENEISKYNLEENITILGKLNPQDVACWLNCFDLMILPSRFEGFPNVLIEWQINGLPCIVSDRITKDVNITKKVFFLPIDPGSPRLWVNQIVNTELLNDRTKLENELRSILMESNLDIAENVRFLGKRYLEWCSMEKWKNEDLDRPMQDYSPCTQAELVKTFKNKVACSMQSDGELKDSLNIPYNNSEDIAELRRKSEDTKKELHLLNTLTEPENGNEDVSGR